MGDTRVAFIDLPRFDRELVSDLLENHTTVEVCPDQLDPRDLSAAVATSRADVLIAGPRLSDPEEVCRLLEAFPRLKALVVLDSGRSATLYELRPSRELGELFPDLLVAAIEKARRRCVDRVEESPPTSPSDP